jgi:ABC-type lipoprotein release transport system permease subunit
MLAAIGTVAGAVCAAWAAQALQSLLFGVNPGDSQVFAAAVAVCVMMALVGSLLPAIRATRVDPLEAIRAD